MFLSREGSQTEATSDQVPRSGSDLQPRVAAAATLGQGIPIRLNPEWGCALFSLPLPNVAAERQRWAGGRYRFAV